FAVIPRTIRERTQANVSLRKLWRKLQGLLAHLPCTLDELRLVSNLIIQPIRLSQAGVGQAIIRIACRGTLKSINGAGYVLGIVVALQVSNAAKIAFVRAADG